MSRWSASTFVIVATVGESARKDRSYSSASTTNSASPPRLRFPFHAATRPPTMPVGSRPRGGERLGGHDGGGRLAVRAGDADRLADPDGRGERLGATDHRDAELARARELRVVLGHRRGGDDARAPATCAGRGRRPRECRAARDRRPPFGLASQPVTAIPRRASSSASALIPAPAMPTKWTGRESWASKSVMR